MPASPALHHAEVKLEVLLKIIHYFSILFAGGVTVGSVIIQAAYIRAGGHRHPISARPSQALV